MLGDIHAFQWHWSVHRITWLALPWMKERMACHAEEICSFPLTSAEQKTSFIYLFQENHSNRPCNFLCVFPIKPLEGSNGVRNIGCWCNQQVIERPIFHSVTRFLQINKPCVLGVIVFLFVSIKIHVFFSQLWHNTQRKVQVLGL